MAQYSIIAESNNFIVLDAYTKYNELHEASVVYQSEASLEREFIQDLVNQGYEYRPDISTPEALLANVRLKIQELNDMEFSDKEWVRFIAEYLDKPGDTLIDKTRKIHDNYIYDFVFDDGHIKNIYLVNKQDITQNKLQVINQFEQSGAQVNRYDVTILVNGLPLVQVELKKRGVAIREAFNQIHRYSKESFNSDNSLFKYIQVFVISNGTDSRYFANTVERNKTSFDFTMSWANAKNTVIKDLKDFTETFFQKNTLLNVIFTYSVFDTNNTLLVMRPYQIAATERMLWKIKSSYQAKKWSTTEGGGYIWHTTGSGKTLTSFKAARLATQLEFIDKVFFVVDRKDLDYQTMKEYQRFSPDSVNGSESTAGLKRNIEKDDNRIIVTTIQKLNNLMKSEDNLPVYQKQVVFIFDECHRSQFGEAQKQLRKKFKKYYQFGFTGTPIFPENANGSETTASVFGRELHSYVITDAIRDEKVLKFKVDYNNVRPRFKNIETEVDEQKLSAAENKQALLHPARINEISQYILQNFRIKTHRNQNNNKGFNAMFTVSGVDAAKCYYEELNRLQKDSKKPLKIATIFSFAANEEQSAIGEISDENFNPSAMDLSSKEFLTKAIHDYNNLFGTSYGIESKEFQNYYRDLAKRVKNKEVDLVIVVGMFLTGFDAPTLNTLFVDKNLRFHGLIQAFSRTNRIYDSTKTFGNIVTFRDLEKHTVNAIRLFGDENTANVVLEKSYQEYLEGFKDIVSGEARKGYIDIVKELSEKFPDTDKIITEHDKKEFVKLFGEYLRVENILQNFDEFTMLKAFQTIDINNKEAVETFKNDYFVTDSDIAKMQKLQMPSDRIIQDYKSTYNDIRDWLRQEKEGNKSEKSRIDWDDVVFEIDLLKSQEINLDYILELIFEHNKKKMDKSSLIEEIRRIIRSSVGNRAKESLIVDFINDANLDAIPDKTEIIKAFFEYAQGKQKEEAAELIANEKLNEREAKHYMEISLKREYASENGTDFNNILPKMSPLNPQYLTKKQTVFQKIVAFIEKFKGVGGQL
ncbi:type I site-specific deoxyribonuclease HsdR family [Bacteroides sp. CAG:633]|uniref:type I restriction endonuclease subunit R n=1 Tax=Bacteroides sp. CAG:633 TaxID=1262744 RepID=UPI0003377700|nr:type I restriction endonuclease subunit R [Bacteroides sp. CAG:633]CDB10661.1 type I site-specific deoxyribonuclease HsdR family [Bacteroides sp. CAG:633]